MPRVARTVPTPPAAPPGRIVAALAYLGGLGILGGAAVGAAFRPGRDAVRLVPGVVRQWDWMLGMGLILVGLVHVPIGSFLAMQSYFGATFTEASGAVVGLGLLRNVAPLLSGLVLAGLFAARIPADLRADGTGRDDDPASVPDRDVARGRAADARPASTPGRRTLIRVLAAATAGPILALWGAAIGTVVGCLVSRSMLGLSPGIFFGLFLEMLDVRDAVGLMGKGAGFAAVAALIACHEGLRPSPTPAATAGFRAAALSTVAILQMNLAWFNLFYLAGPAFGPSVK